MIAGGWHVLARTTITAASSLVLTGHLKWMSSTTFSSTASRPALVPTLSLSSQMCLPSQPTRMEMASMTMTITALTSRIPDRKTATVTALEMPVASRALSTRMEMASTMMSTTALTSRTPDRKTATVTGLEMPVANRVSLDLPPTALASPAVTRSPASAETPTQPPLTWS